MQTANNISIREASIEEGTLISEHFYKMWLTTKTSGDNYGQQ